MAELIRNLNREQREAVRHQAGPMLVVAGPGTGKTRVLTHHLAYLVQYGRLDPENILALTFTQRAAQEMAERADQLFPGEYLNLPVYTFHGWAQQLLEAHGLDIGRPVPFRVLAERDLRILVSQNWERFEFDYYQPRGSNRSLIANLIIHFGRCKDENIRPDQYLNSFAEPPADSMEDQRRQELARAYQCYQDILLENEVVDFGDLLCDSLKLLQERPQIRRQYQQQIKHLLIDEFQDTNLIQYQLARILSGPDNNLMVCASADQTIYQWRGAYYGNVEQFLKDYPKAKKVTLQKNYRSAQNIIDLSYKFIKGTDRFDHRLSIQGLQATQSGRGIIKSWRFEHYETERQVVAEEVANLIKAGTDPAQIAVLTRTNEQVYAFEEALSQLAVPVRAMTAGQIYRQSIVIDILSYLTLQLDRYNDAAFYRYLNFPHWSLSDTDRAIIVNLSHRQGRPLVEALQKSADRLSSRGRSAIQPMIKWLDHDRRPLVSQLLSFLEDSGYLKKWLRTNPNQVELEALNFFFEELNQFEQNHPDLGLNHFLEQIEWERSFGRQATVGQVGGAVSVLTVHGAKGLEFDYVFLVDLVDQVFPARRQSALIPWLNPEIDRLRHISEERRLFFVAMTRARHGLYFSWAEDRGGQRQRKASPFLSELELKEESVSRLLKKSTSGVPIRKSFEKLPDHFSYTQLISFQTCPWQYRLSHLLRVPTKGSPERSLGTTFHNTLAEFMAVWASQTKPLRWSDLKQFYQQHWIEDWYQNQSQRQQYYQRGLQGLKVFYHSLIKEKPQVYHDGHDFWLEKEFVGQIGGYPFRGKIDRVDQTDEGLELIDYKTGAYKEKLSSDQKQQLLIYQLAAEQILKIKPVRLTFYYLLENRKQSFLGSDKEKERALQKLSRTVEEIKQSDFKARPGHACQHCDFRLICPYRR